MRAPWESRERTTSLWLLMTAWNSGVRRSLSFSSQSILYCSKVRTIPLWPFCAAMWSGLSYSLFFLPEELDESSLRGSGLGLYELWLIFAIGSNWAKGKSLEERPRMLLGICLMTVWLAGGVCEVETVGSSRSKLYEKGLSLHEEPRLLGHWGTVTLYELKSDSGER